MTIQTTVLDNGLTVVTDHMPYVKGQSFRWLLKSGSATEHKPGVAHFHEHMVANYESGPDHQRATSYLETISNEVNASTGFKLTNFYILTLPRDMSDVMRTMAGAIMGNSWNPSIFEAERKRILHEYEIAQDNVGVIFSRMRDARMYPNSYLEGTVIGTPNSIKDMTLDDIHRHHSENFAASRMFLVFAGPQTHDENVIMADRFFGLISPGDPAPQVMRPLATAGHYAVSRKDISEQFIQVAMPWHDVFHAEGIPMGMATTLMGRHLNQKMKESGSYASPFVGLYRYDDHGYILTGLSVLPGQANQKLHEVARIIANPAAYINQEWIESSVRRDAYSAASCNDSPSYRTSRLETYIKNGQKLRTIEETDEIWKSNLQLDRVMAAAHQIVSLPVSIFAHGPHNDVMKPDEFADILESARKISAPSSINQQAFSEASRGTTQRSPVSAEAENGALVQKLPSPVLPGSGG